MNASIVLLTSHCSSTIFTFPLVFPRVKFEPRLEVRIDISHLSNDQKKSSVQPYCPLSKLPSPSSNSENSFGSTSSSLPSLQIVKPKKILLSLRKLGSMFSLKKTSSKKSISIPFVVSKFPSYLNISMGMSSTFSLSL